MAWRRAHLESEERRRGLHWGPDGPLPLHSTRLSTCTLTLCFNHEPYSVEQTTVVYFSMLASDTGILCAWHILAGYLPSFLSL